MVKGEELSPKEILNDLTFVIQNNVYDENDKSLGKYRLYALKTEYSVKDFTDLIFNPILGLKTELIKQLSLRSTSRNNWLIRVNQLKKIYFSVRSYKATNISKKTIQLSLELRGNGNDTKPLILVNLS